VVPCGRRKIGDAEPFRGPVSAASAYAGTPLWLNRQYAERFGDAWVALSAKYGFITPGVIIAELYEVPFKRGTSPGLPKRPGPLPKRRHHLR
jgi:hypothetical protein